ncbi:MAG TPA: S8 family serine peptidase [Gemmatimonadaceae bacterium]|jgi:subtilisin family serine protease|nr:S8 family serine peptidase [Gemmatimonadaceae bacterium]
MKRWVPIAVVAFAVTACQDASGPSAKLASVTPKAALITAANPIPDSYIVVLKNAVANVDGEVDQIGQNYGTSATYRYKNAVKGFAGKLSPAALEALRNDPRIAYIEQNQTMSLSTTQTGATWGIDRIDQRGLPLSTTYVYDADGTGVTVYIIDTGINFTHNEYNGRAFTGIDEVTSGGTAADCNGHGSHVSGTVAGTTYGVAKNAKLVAVRVLDCSGSGSTAGVIAGIDWVTAQKNANKSVPSAANMSLGGSLSTTLNQAVENSVAAGVVYAIAAGNSSADACTFSPASAPNAITVGATDINDGFASFSNRGSCVDINAPGVNITSAWMGSNTATNTISGTSMATPHVAGTIALYLQVNPTATAAQVDAALKTNSSTTATVPAGTTNRFLYSAFITAGPPTAPVARFTFACGGPSCNFDGSSSSAQAAASYAWTFGDGSTGSGRTASHAYAAAGTYGVTLTVADGGGTSSATQSVTVTAAVNSVARFTKSCSSRTCTFDASTSSNATSFAWNFGDGTTATGVSTSHRFARNRSYTVTLTTQPGNSTATAGVTCRSSCT